MDICALCGKEAVLELSHIIPKFVFDYVKRTSVTSRFRTPLDNPDVPKQDGDKKKLLCGECEDLFSEQERLFANNLFHKFQKDNIQEINYDRWLNYFITSVNWRVLKEDIEYFKTDNTVTSHEIQLMLEAEQTMRDYLLKRRDDLQYIENHIFLFDEVQTTNNSEVIEGGPNVFFRRSVFGYSYVVHNPTGIYVYSNLAGILIVTIVKSIELEVWENTKVELGLGKLQMPQNISSPLMDEMIEYMLESKKVSLSLAQKEKLVERVKKDPEKLVNSKFIEHLKQDQNLKRDF